MPNLSLCHLILMTSWIGDYHVTPTLTLCPWIAVLLLWCSSCMVLLLEYNTRDGVNCAFELRICIFVNKLLFRSAKSYNDAHIWNDFDTKLQLKYYITIQLYNGCLDHLYLPLLVKHIKRLYINVINGNWNSRQWIILIVYGFQWSFVETWTSQTSVRVPC